MTVLTPGFVFNGLWHRFLLYYIVVNIYCQYILYIFTTKKF